MPTTTSIGSLSAAIVAAAESTAAAPDMSHFIVNMPSEGLSDSPPESKVTPLPTSASWGTASAAARPWPVRPAPR